MKPIKIIWFTFFKHSIYDDLLNALTETNDLDVHCVLAKDSDDNTIKYKKIIVPSSNILLPVTFFKYIPNFKYFYDLLSSDVYLINYYSSLRSYQIYRLAKKRNVKLIICAEEKKREGLLRKIFLGLWDITAGRSMIKYSSLIMPWTNESKMFISKFTNDKRKIVQISAGIDTSIFYPEEKRYEKCNTLLNILMVAKFENNKSHKTLIEALHYLKINHHLQFHLTLVGRDSGGIKETIIKKIDEFNLNDNVNILNSVDKSKMRELYNSFDLLVLPSRQEPIGMVVPEAMACGTPVIVSDKVGAKYFIDDGVSGFIFKAGDAFDLGKKILRAHSSDLQLLGKNSADNIKNNYSIHSMAKNIYSAIIGEFT